MSPDILIAWALQTGLSVTILIGLILLIRRPFAKRFGAKAAYALWALPFLRLFTPSIELPWLRPEAAPNWTEAALTPQTFALLQQSSLAPPASPSLWAAYGSILMAAVWGLGAVCFAIWQICRQRRMVQIWTQDAQLASPQLCALSRDIALSLQLKRAPQLLLSPTVSGPLVTGALRPKVILPDNFEIDFSQQEQRYTLLHELAHIRRGDLYATIAALVLRALNWPNPLLHIAARYFRADQEAACDATVLAHVPRQEIPHNHSHDYAQTLMKAALHAQTHMTPHMSAPALALTIHHPLKERLMILSNPAPHQKLKHRLAACAIAAIVMAVNAPINFVPSAQSTELAGKAQTPTPPTPPATPSLEKRREAIVYGDNKQTHIIRSVSQVNGVEQDRKVEIQVEGDNVRAFEIDPKSGTKTEINPETIDGYENITKGAGRFLIDDENGQVVRFEQFGDGDVQGMLEKLKEDGAFNDDMAVKVLKLVNSSDSNGKTFLFNEDGGENTILTGKVEFEFDDDDFTEDVDVSKFFDGKNIKIKVLKSYSEAFNADSGDDVKVFFSDNEFPEFETATRLQAVESILESADNMLGEMDETNRDLKKAQKELSEALKALEKARATLEDEK